MVGRGMPWGRKSWKSTKAISESLIYIFRKMRFEELEYQSLLPGRILHHRRNDSTSDLPWVSSDYIRKWFLSLCTTWEEAVPWHAALSFALFTTWERLVEHEGKAQTECEWREMTWAGCPGLCVQVSGGSNQLCSLHQLWWARHHRQNEWSPARTLQPRAKLWPLRLQRPTEIT